MSSSAVPTLDEIPNKEDWELGVAILRSLGPDGTMSFHGLVERCFGPYQQQHDGHPAVARLSDAWAWLLAHGFIGPTSSSPTAYRATSRGRGRSQHNSRSTGDLW